jgi:prepilin-type N-terminal cleavage/methylation domain-containing protein
MRRRGLTLFELILVIALILIVTSIIVPSVDALMEPYTVQAAVDKIRTQWTETRTRAMEDGIAYRFSIQEGTGNYRVESDDPAFDVPAKEGALPQDCVFTAPGTTQVSAAAPGQWQSIAVFLPDGTAREDASLSFGVAGMAPTTLRLRALTGSITTDDGSDGNGGAP